MLWIFDIIPWNIIQETASDFILEMLLRSLSTAYDEQCYLYVKSIEKTNTIVSIFCYFKELEFKMFYSVRLFTNNEILCETRASENCILVDFSAINAVNEVA